MLMLELYIRNVIQCLKNNILIQKENFVIYDSTHVLNKIYKRALCWQGNHELIKFCPVLVEMTEKLYLSRRRTKANFKV